MIFIDLKKAPVLRLHYLSNSGVFTRSTYFLTEQWIRAISWRCLNEKRANSFILFCCICNFRLIRADFAFFGQFWPIKIRNIGKFHWLDFFLDQFDRFIYKSVFWDYFFLLFFQGFEPDSKISEKRKFPEAWRVKC